MLDNGEKLYLHQNIRRIICIFHMTIISDDQIIRKSSASGECGYMSSRHKYLSTTKCEMQNFGYLCQLEKGKKDCVRFVNVLAGGFQCFLDVDVNPSHYPIMSYSACNFLPVSRKLIISVVAGSCQA